MIPIREIENHLERFDARYSRMIKIEAIRVEEKRRERIVRTVGGMIAIGCALYAVAVNL